MSRKVIEITSRRRKPSLPVRRDGELPRPRPLWAKRVVKSLTAEEVRYWLAKLS